MGNILYNYMSYSVYLSSNQNNNKKSKIKKENLMDINKNEDESIETEYNSVFNMEKLLADNILHSEYFKTLFRFNKIDEVINEFAEHAFNLEPRIIGYPKPSTAFCILYKLFTMKLNRKSVEKLVNHRKPLVRCLGYLYLRYLLKPTRLWEFFEPGFEDIEEVQV